MSFSVTVEHKGRGPFVTLFELLSWRQIRRSFALMRVAAASDSLKSKCRRGAHARSICSW